MAAQRIDHNARANSNGLANLMRQAQEEIQHDTAGGLQDLRLICLDENRVLYTSPSGPLSQEQALNMMLTSYLSTELGFNIELQFVEEAG